MESEILYKVKPEELPKLEDLLNKCFATDPLYAKLIPDEEVRKRLMPELFKCDMTEFYETCEIFADSKELNGVLVVSDEAEPYNALKYYFTEAQVFIKGGSFTENPVSFYTGAGLFKFQLDKPASCEEQDSYHISGG